MWCSLVAVAEAIAQQSESARVADRVRVSDKVRMEAMATQMDGGKTVRYSCINCGAPREHGGCSYCGTSEVKA